MKKITIMEVGMRDGLQVVNEKIEANVKLSMINTLISSGIKNIQVGSLVNPKKIPQMKNIDELILNLPKKSDLQYSTLVFNNIGVERALKLGIKKIETSISLSQTYNKKNLGLNLSQSTENLKMLVKAALQSNLKIRAGLQCVWGCPYDGDIAENEIIKKLSDILDMGISKIALCDTSGMATPRSISELFETIFKTFPKIELCIHLHNTYGRGLTNLSRAMQFDIIEIDTSFGGIGGSPFIEGSSGNIATEDTLNLLERLGYHTGINIRKIAELSRKFEGQIGRGYFSGQFHRSLK